MSDAAEPTPDIKWHDRRLLLRSAAVGVLCFALFWGLAKRAEPPEGHVFERLPPISGIYKCCEAGGRYSQSWVGGTGINCLGISYFQLGTGRNDCGLKNELNQRPVVVEQMLIPTIRGPAPMVQRISSVGKDYYRLTDQRILDLWMTGSRTNAFTLAFILLVIFHGAQIVYVGRPINTKGMKL